MKKLTCTGVICLVSLLAACQVYHPGNSGQEDSGPPIANPDSVVCRPDCEGKECGNNGCGGYCEPGCRFPDQCLEGQCLRSPDIHAPPSSTLPVIDGMIEPGEWDQATEYDLITEEGITLRLWAMTHRLDGDELCSIYPDNPGYLRPCGSYLLMAFEADPLNSVTLYFDEGDDGGRGSGSSDGVLGPGQGDLKKITSMINGWQRDKQCQAYFDRHLNCPEPGCVPWSDQDCWMCAHPEDHPWGDHCQLASDPSQTADPVSHDVYAAPGDGFHTANPNNPDLISWSTIFPNSPGWQDDEGFLGFVRLDTGRQAEILIPFLGLDRELCWETCDKSDLVFDYGDELRFFISSWAGIYPWGADLRDPLGWSLLVIDPLE